MRSKRGVKRSACDFCHIRKMKCNRLSRAREGLDKCSACVSHQIDCLVEGSVSTRTVRTQEPWLSQTHSSSLVSEENEAMTPQTNSSHFSLPNRSPLLTPKKRAMLWDNVNYEAAFSESLIDPLSQARPVSSSPANQSPEMVLRDTPTSSLRERPINTPTIEQSLESTLSGTPIDIDLSNVQFLDQIFLGDGEFLEKDIPQPITNATALGLETSHHVQGSDRNPGFKLWLQCNLDEAIFVAALEAYFHYPGLCPPFILEDAFWEDYNADRCSPAILFALACRGLPFMRLPSKFETQQCLAQNFRVAFLEACNISPSLDSIRLDDLEALALMVDFEYVSDSLESYPGLVDRYLGHECLVQMTLQCFKNDGLTRGGSLILTRAVERQKLLFWHVFGIDAFRSLDKKTISDIPDGDFCLTEDVHGFFNAIISLAVIARNIVSDMCNDTAKYKGIKPSEVSRALEQLQSWGNNIGPLVVDGKVGKDLLHATILTFLRSNCYMQIESCISEYGILSEIPTEKEFVKERVQYMCLKLVKLHLSRPEDINRPLYARSIRRPLVDISPSILRNICAGMCTWVCLQAKELLPNDLLQSLQLELCLQTPIETSHRFIGRKRRTWDRTERCKMSESLPEMRKCAQTAKELRGIVEAASSHSDTPQILERLDATIGAVDRVVDFIDELISSPGIEPGSSSR